MYKCTTSMYNKTNDVQSARADRETHRSFERHFIRQVRTINFLSVNSGSPGSGEWAWGGGGRGGGGGVLADRTRENHSS